MYISFISGIYLEILNVLVSDGITNITLTTYFAMIMLHLYLELILCKMENQELCL